MADGPEQGHARSNPPAAPDGGGDWRLTLDERKRILLNNIYGVDIDPQAVEVTKLSLLLKVLEGENGRRWPRRCSSCTSGLLPDLGSNIKLRQLAHRPGLLRQPADDAAGRGRDGTVSTSSTGRQDFADVFAERPGFDAVIGNPPYIRMQDLKEWAPHEAEYYKRRYKAASKGNYDIYVVFVEKGLELLKHTGLLGHILPHKFFNAQYGEPLRSLISEAGALNGVVYFGDQQVFEAATTYTCLLFLKAEQLSKFSFSIVEDLSAWSRDSGRRPHRTPQRCNRTPTGVELSKWRRRSTHRSTQQVGSANGFNYDKSVSGIGHER